MKREREAEDMATVRLTITTTFSDGLYFYELSANDSLDTVKMLLESESGISVADQVCVNRRLLFCSCVSIVC